MKHTKHITGFFVPLVALCRKLAKQCQACFAPLSLPRSFWKPLHPLKAGNTMLFSVTKLSQQSPCSSLETPTALVQSSRPTDTAIVRTEAAGFFVQFSCAFVFLTKQSSR
jgi:hypothetical protein